MSEKIEEVKLEVKDIDEVLAKCEAILSDPRGLDKMYMSTLFVKKIFPLLRCIKKIYQYLKYHIFTLHIDIENRLTKLEKQNIPDLIKKDDELTQMMNNYQNTMNNSMTQTNQKNSSLETRINNLEKANRDLNQRLINLENPNTQA